jgi:HEAT repeats/Putative zinc-finger
MKCDLAQRNIALVVYGELPDEEYHALEQHLAGCTRCREEFEAVKALQQAMAFAPSEEPSANLLAQTRIRLEEALDNLPRNGWLVRAKQSIMGGFATLGRAPIAASALLLLGLGLGAVSGYRAAQHGSQPSGTQAPGSQASAAPAQIAAEPSAPMQVANVSSIVRDPNSENVQVQFNRLVPETVHGSLDDPQIRQLLLLGAQSGLNPEIQQNSVSLLADECLAGHQCADGPVRKALLVALRYDRSPEVRLKALDGLEPYVAEDMRVRDSVLEALMKDSDPAIRSRAIELLQPVQADSSVREVLHTVASEDDNPHIRTVSREVLDQMPQIQ